MFGQVIRALIFICFMVLLYYIVLYVLEAIGLRIPPHIATVIMVILGLIAILVLYQLFAPYIGGVNWWGGPPNPAIALFVASAALSIAFAGVPARAAEPLTSPRCFQTARGTWHCLTQRELDEYRQPRAEEHETVPPQDRRDHAQPHDCNAPPKDRK